MNKNQHTKNEDLKRRNEKEIGKKEYVEYNKAFGKRRQNDGIKSKNEKEEWNKK